MLYFISILASLCSYVVLSGLRNFPVEELREFSAVFIILHLTIITTTSTSKEIYTTTRGLLSVLSLFFIGWYGLTLAPYLPFVPSSSAHGCTRVEERCAHISLSYLDARATYEADIATRLHIARVSPDIIVIRGYTPLLESSLGLTNRYLYTTQVLPQNESRQESLSTGITVFSRYPLGLEKSSSGEDIDAPLFWGSISVPDSGLYRLAIAFGEERTPIRHLKNTRRFRRLVTALKEDAKSSIIILASSGTLLTPHYRQFLWALNSAPLWSFSDLGLVKSLTLDVSGDDVLIRGAHKKISWSRDSNPTDGTKLITTSFYLSPLL
jgi:hypothetical protein